MANYTNLLATIAANIYTNNNNEVTAAMVKAVEDAMVASLGAGYQYMGIATPATNPNSPDYKCFYIAETPGTYTNFGGIVVNRGEIALISGTGTSWSVSVILDTAAEQEYLSELKLSLGGWMYIRRWGNLDYTNKWSDVDSNHIHGLFRCHGGAKVNITAGANVCNFAFLTSAEFPVAGQDLPLCSGQSRQSIAANTSSETYAPEDCEYLAVLLRINAASDNYAPSILTINGENAFQSNKGELFKGRISFHRNGALDYTDTWSNVDALHRHFLINISAGDVVNVVASANNCILAFLTSDAAPVAGQSLPLCAGTNRITIPANGAQSFVAPGDAKYLAVLASYGAYTDQYAPAVLTINGLDALILQDPQTLFPKCIIRYDSVGQAFSIYLRDEEKQNIYYLLTLSHVVDHSDLVYLDMWRITGANGVYALVGGSFVSAGVTLLNSGENELAMKFSGTGDFTGGYHGDERIDISPDSYAKFFLDGVEITPGGSDFEITGSEFYLLESSTLHETSASMDTYVPGHPVIGTHFKKTIFSGQGYEVFNKVIFAASLYVNTWFSGLCCVAKQCSDYFYGENFVINTAQGNDGSISCGVVGGIAEFWSTFNKTRCRVDSEVLSEDDKLCWLSFWDRAAETKYYRYVPQASVGIGTIFENRMKVVWSIER